jgi:alginate O-acetyltransferase complex protein AlgJ
MPKKPLFRYFIFFLPFMIALGVELFVLPIDFFTFKVWEALLVKNSFGILQGPFYPHMHLSKIEQGDLAHHTPYTTFKDSQWWTDRYGYRKKDADTKRYDIVIIGDSNIAGSGLTQSDMLSELVGRQTGLSVYPLAPGGTRRFSNHPLFARQRPAIIVFASIERDIAGLRAPKIRFAPAEPNIFDRLAEHFQQNRTLQVIAKYLDRVRKGNMVNYFRSAIRRAGLPPPACTPVGDRCFFFLQGTKANKPVPEEKMANALAVISRYHEILKAQGIRFIFLPIPNKETIYYDYLGTERPHFLLDLQKRLRERGVEVIDTQTAFDDALRNRQVLLYHPDDTHWNPNGSRLTARLLSRHLQSGGSPVKP